MSSRTFYNTGAPFLYTGGEATVGPGMDCLQLRQPPAPFHYLISEQAKSLVALQELQHEVGALLEFRDLVIETFPNLRTKLTTNTTTTPSSSATMITAHHSPSNIPISIRPGDWTPGVRVRKKIGGKELESRMKKTTDNIAVQDSGFSTETSSKETHSSTSAPNPTVGTTTDEYGSAGTHEESGDELWNLLDLIHRRGTRLKDEVDALQGALHERGGAMPDDFQQSLLYGSADDLRQLRQERDLLLDRLAEMEAEVIAGRVHTSRLQEDLEDLLMAKQELEEQLKAVVTQRGEVNSRIHDLHLQFVTKSDGGKVTVGDRVTDCCGSGGSQRTQSELDAVLGARMARVRAPDTGKIAAILREHDPRVLQKHLLNSTVQNQALHEKLNSAVKLELGLTDKLNKAREENDELRFQLEDKNVELVGTKAQLRMLEKLAKSSDVLPDRSEISTASMKAMSPLPLNLQTDHSSSTESAHDLAESARKRRPSKIPLKSYSAPKPPSAPRSRSGDSPGRPHSAQSWRNRNDSSLNSGGGTTKSHHHHHQSASLPKSRNGSLISAKDSLSSKLRSSDSLSRLADSNSFGRGMGTLQRKNGGGMKWSNNGGGAAAANGGGGGKDVADKESLNSKTAKSPFPWILSSYNSESGSLFPDSLDRSGSSMQPTTIETSSSHRFQTANTFLWNVIGGGSTQHSEFYDSIDTNLTSSLYQHENAESDSLEKHK